MTATDSFAIACGQLRPLRLAVEHADGGRIAEGELTQPHALIGSGARCEITLHHTDVPERVACLQVLDGHAFVIALNGFAIHRLTPESPFVVGAFAIRLFEPPANEPISNGDPLRDRVSDGLLPRGRLTCRSDPDSPASMEIDRRLTFLVARSDPVAYLTLTRDGLFVTDLLTPIGTRVNGEVVRTARLADGDVLCLGPVQYDVRFGEQDSVWRPTVGPPSESLSPRESLDDADSVEQLVPLVPSASATVPHPAGLHPRRVAIPSQVGELSAQWIDRFRRTVEAMLADFGNLRPEQLVALRDEMASVSGVLAQLARPRDRSGVTVLPQQPVERPAASAAGEVLPASAETAAEHLELHDRLAVLERERTGLWKRLRGLLGA